MPESRNTIQDSRTSSMVLMGKLPMSTNPSPERETCKDFEHNPKSSKNSVSRRSISQEIISDSEEERLRLRRDQIQYEKQNAGRSIEIIEISSDEDDTSPNGMASGVDDPFLDSIPGAWSFGRDGAKKSVNVSSSPAEKTMPRKKPSYRSSKQNDSEGPQIIPRIVRRQPEIIELSDSSPERPSKTNLEFKSKDIHLDLGDSISSDANELYPSNLRDEAILILNEPKSARKPIYLGSLLHGTPRSSFRNSPGPSKSRKRLELGSESSNGGDKFIFTTDPTPTALTSYPSPSLEALSTPPSNRSPSKPRQPPRSGKKAQAAVEQARREAYAQQFFIDINRLVFEDGLPQETQLKWNKRLLTTAGRAKWHRSKDGVHTTEIELAQKILDCDERIRNTLSHEMCHLACWIIDQDPKEGHGKLWKRWADKVMRKRPEVEITTRHDYEISYPFEWECEQCAKIYGRFSKSIRPDECYCGACKVGKLVPLFGIQATRKHKITAGSRMAATKSQDSPLRSTPISSRLGDAKDYQDLYESDSEVKILTTVLGGIRISDKEKV